MDDLYHHLETQVKALVQYCEQLKKTNHKLVQTQPSLIREKEILVSKHRGAITQIEKLVTHLKSLEELQ